MGQEARCVAWIGERRVEVKALLETEELILRGEHRQRLPFAILDSVEAADGLLALRHADQTLVLELGPQAERWAAKIRNPPTLLDKLGVKADQRVALVGLTEQALIAQVSQRAAVPESPGTDLDLVFLQVETIADLGKLDALRSAITQDGAIWIVHLKGRADLKDTHIIEAGRAAGLVDNKVARISERYSALCFVIPRAARQTGNPRRRAAG